jgi:hypothetical protein
MRYSIMGPVASLKASVINLLSLRTPARKKEEAKVGVIGLESWPGL